MVKACLRRKARRRTLGSSPALESAKNPKQENGTNRCHGNGRQIEAFRIVEAKKSADNETADESADDADDKIGQQAMIAASDPFGEPAGKDADDQPGDDTHEDLLATGVVMFIAL